MKSKDQMAMFSTVLALLTLVWFCFLCVYFGHIFFSQKIGTNQFECTFSKENLL